MSLMTYSQNKRQVLGVISIDTKGNSFNREALLTSVRMEAEKLDTFQVIDKYDIEQALEKNSLSTGNCFGKNSLVEMGSLLKADLMLTGSVEQLERNIIISYRLIDVKSGAITKTYAREFLNNPAEIQLMVQLSIQEFFGRRFDVFAMSKLCAKFALDNSINNPDNDILVLNGPRMGFISYTGELRDIITNPKSKGGYDMFPVMFQFGYQFEKQYLNEGKVQALFEFIPMVTGLDQGHFFPSLTVLHGVRSNTKGWEFGFGPSVNFTSLANGYYDNNNQWHLQEDWAKDPNNKGKDNPYESKKRLDNRGDLAMESFFVIALGKTFRSGKLNIPVNAYVIPGKLGWRFGISFGFNARKK